MDYIDETELLLFAFGLEYEDDEDFFDTDEGIDL
jgi:hypothetical protein